MRLIVILLAGLISALSISSQTLTPDYQWFQDGSLFYRIISEPEGTAGLSLPYNTSEKPQALTEAENYLNNLTELQVPATATDPSTNISYKVVSVFSGCLDNREKLESLYLPDDMLEINGMNYLPSLKTLQLPANLEKITGLFHVSALENLELPQSLKYIGDQSISYTGIKNLVIPDGIEYLGVNSLCFNNNLETLEFNGITAPMAQCVMYSNNLKKVTLPSTTFYTDWHSFSMLENLQEIWIGNSLGNENAAICSQAFSGLSNLKSIYSPRMTPPEITELNSMNTPLCFNGSSAWPSITLYVPAGYIDAYSKSYCWKDMNIQEYDFDAAVKQITINSESTVITVDKGLKVMTPQQLSIFTSAGFCVASGTYDEGALIHLSSGVYIIQTESENLKLIIK